MNRTAPAASRRRAQRISVFALACALLCGAAYLTRAALLRSAGEMWLVSDQLEPADAVVVLGGRPDVRPLAAAKLYKNGLARTILVSSSVLGSEPELDALRQLGIPSDAMVTLGHELASTYEEAVAVAAWASRSGARRIIIPTDVFRARRTQWIFNRELAPIHVAVMVEAVTPPQYTIKNWWQQRNAGGMDEFGVELVKYVYYRLVY